MLGHLEGMFGEVRRYIWKEGGYKKIEEVRANPKMVDVSRKFDLQAEGMIVSYCKLYLREEVKIITEERGEINLCESPKWILVVDPVDGSTNLRRGVEGSATSLAVLSATELKPEYALIGSIISGGYCETQRGKGVYYRGPFSGWREVQAATSKIESLEAACVEVDLDFALDETSSEIDQGESKKIGRILPLL